MEHLRFRGLVFGAGPDHLGYDQGQDADFLIDVPDRCEGIDTDLGIFSEIQKIAFFDAADLFVAAPQVKDPQLCTGIDQVGQQTIHEVAFSGSCRSGNESVVIGRFRMKQVQGNDLAFFFL